jgi:hypothetical protein
MLMGCLTSRRGPGPIRTVPLILALCVSTVHPAPAQARPDSSWREVSGILQGSPVDAGGYVRYNFPRKDLSVRVGDVGIPAGFALTSWVGFDGNAANATAMGDLVVTATELGPVLAELARQHVAVTAIHNHLIGESPQVLYVHFHADGPTTGTAWALSAALGRTAVPRPASPAAPAPVTIDTSRVFSALGVHGRANGAMAQVGILLVGGGVAMDGHELLGALAYGSPVNILQVAADRFVATGDFAVVADRLQPLLEALAANDITATAVHTHLVGENPKVYFVHFWGDAPLEPLLRGLRAAVAAGRAS